MPILGADMRIKCEKCHEIALVRITRGEDNAPVPIEELMAQFLEQGFTMGGSGGYYCEHHRLAPVERENV